MPSDKNKLYTPAKTYLEQCDLALIKAVVEGEMPFDKTFACAIDRESEHLVCVVDYDSEFYLEGEDLNNDSYQDWIRISVKHPRYLLYMANIMVRTKDGMLNMDEEIKLDYFQIPELISLELIGLLHEVLLPAIKSHVGETHN